MLGIFRAGILLKYGPEEKLTFEIIRKLLKTFFVP
jgi:hypothetical protein